MAPTPASISCRMARSSSVAASNIQSCSIPAPSPNGFSRLSFGPLTYPSSEVELSKDHERQECFLSVLLHWPIQTVLIYTDDARRHFSSASHPIKSRLSVLRPPPTTNDQRDDRQ